MPNSTATALPQKPRRDFPLTPRANGRWCKRVNGRLDKAEYQKLLDIGVPAGHLVALGPAPRRQAE